MHIYYPVYNIYHRKRYPYMYSICTRFTEFTAASTDQLDIRLFIASCVVAKSANVGYKLTTYKISHYVLGFFFI
jgi:hypothetical protein